MWKKEQSISGILSSRVIKNGLKLMEYVGLPTQNIAIKCLTGKDVYNQSQGK